MFALAATLLAALPLLASATSLKVTQPTAAGWIGNTTVTVAWDWSATDPQFSIELANPNIQSGLLAAGPIAVATTLNANIGSKSFDLPVVPAGYGYMIQLVNINDINEVYAVSPTFALSDNPFSTTVIGSNTAGGGSVIATASSVSASKTASGSKASTSSHASTSSAANTGSAASTSTGATVSAASSSSASRTFLSTPTVASSTGTGAAASTSSPANAASSVASLGWTHAGVSGVALGAVLMGLLAI